MLSSAGRDLLGGLNMGEGGSHLEGGWQRVRERAHALGAFSPTAPSYSHKRATVPSPPACARGSTHYLDGRSERGGKVTP